MPTSHAESGPFLFPFLEDPLPVPTPLSRELLRLLCSAHEARGPAPSLLLLDGLEEYLVEDPESQEAAYLAAPASGHSCPLQTTGLGLAEAVGSLWPQTQRKEETVEMLCSWHSFRGISLPSAGCSRMQQAQDSAALRASPQSQVGWAPGKNGG